MVGILEMGGSEKFLKTSGPYINFLFITHTFETTKRIQFGVGWYDTTGIGPITERYENVPVSWVVVIR
jgi:hypothetical protein